MSLIFVTGAPGAGKTEVAKELLGRGFEAHDTDDPNRTGIAGWHNLATGEYVAGFNEIDVTPDFLEGHAWQVTPRAVSDYKDRSGETDIYLCGALREPGPVLEASDLIIFLAVNADTIRTRLTERAKKPGEVEWGREPWQVERSIQRNEVLMGEYQQLGAVMIDATQPVPMVVDGIVEAVRLIR